MKRELNIYLEIFLYLVIIRHIIAFFTSILQFEMAISGFGYIISIIWNAILNIIMIISLLNILKVKRWALYLFGGIQIVNIIFQWLVLNEDLMVISIVAIILCTIMSALLCIRKNGVSAWRTFFPEKDSMVKDYNKIDLKILEDDTIITSDSNIPVEKNKLENNEIKENKTELKEYIATLPRMNDGSLNYNNMSNIQRFAYTYTTESPEVALKDLNSDILVKKRSILKLKKEIALLSGAERIKFRDLLHEEIKLLDELYEIRNKYFKHKSKIYNRINKKTACIILLIIFLLTLGYIFYIKKDASLKFIENKEVLHEDSDASNRDKIDHILISNTSNKNKINQILALSISNRDKIYYILKSTGMIDSKEDFFYKFDNNENIRKKVYDRLRKEGYKDSETEFYKLMMPNKIYYEDYISEIYYELTNAGYTKSVLGNEKQFSSSIAESNYRRRIYEYIKANENLKIDDFNVFEKKILLAINRRWLYDKLSNEYNLGNYEFYNKKMDNEDKRKAIYKVAIEENLEVGSWIEFNERFSK